MRATLVSIFGLFFLPSMCIAVCDPVTDWGPCIPFDPSLPCGEGYRERNFTTCKPEIAFLPCTTCSKEVKDCKYTEFTAWSACNVHCGNGHRFSFRLVTQYPSGGGEPCKNMSLAETCNTHACPKDCNVGDWSVWSKCHLPTNDTVEVTCSNEMQHGLQTRTRKIETFQSYRPGSDQTCPESEESRYCNAFPCKIDCDQSSWTDWSDCSASCGTASRRRTRHTKHQSQNGGADCGAIEEVESCDNYDCGLVDLKEDCEDKTRPQFLLLPDVCPHDVVYCPGNKAAGYVKSCPEGEAWDSRHWECVDEDDICEDGYLKHHHHGRYRHGYKRHGYGHRGYGYGYGSNYRYGLFRPYGNSIYPQQQQLPISPAFKPFPVSTSSQNYYPQSQTYQQFPAVSQSAKNYYPQQQQQQQVQQSVQYPVEPAQSGQQIYQQEPAQQQFYPQEPAQFGQQFFPQNKSPSGKKFRGVPPSFLCQSEGEFRTGECNTYWQCRPGQQSKYIRCPGRQKFQESSATRGRCDPNQSC